MNIGLDVDGVLVDVRTFQLREGKRYFEKKFGISIKNPDMFEVQDVFECTKKQREAFWIKYIWKYCLKEPMTDNAAEVVNKLRKEGHKVIIITSRVPYNRNRNYRETVSMDVKTLAEEESADL